MPKLEAIRPRARPCHGWMSAGPSPILALVPAMFALSVMARAQDPLPPEDQWFQIQKIDDRTFAIKEVHYWQYNVNYLILGDERAILFDTGPGVYSIRKVVERSPICR